MLLYCPNIANFFLLNQNDKVFVQCLINKCSFSRNCRFRKNFHRHYNNQNITPVSSRELNCLTRGTKRFQVEIDCFARGTKRNECNNFSVANSFKAHRLSRITFVFNFYFKNITDHQPSLLCIAFLIYVNICFVFPYTITACSHSYNVCF